MTQREVDYIIWQNRALRFYLAARALYYARLFAPAAYCAHQALELIMKATLNYWDQSFHPRDAGHNLRKMTRMINNKARTSQPFRLDDLRHCYAQWLVDAGASEARVQVGMRHATAAMTRRYAMQRDKGENAKLMANLLLPARTA